MSETAVPEHGEAAPAPSAASEAMAAAASGGDERLSYRGVFQRLFVRPEIGAIVGAGAIWAFFWAVSREFGTAGGAASILDVSVTLGIMAVAVSLLMIGGEFDLSSGAATGTLAIITILLVKDVGELGGAGLSLWIAIPLSLIFALGLGWANGTMVETNGLTEFHRDLATFFILRGFKLGFSKLMIDNLTVGRIERGQSGYDFWRADLRLRLDSERHTFEGRDALYTIGVVGGLALVAFRRHGAELRPTREDAPGQYSDLCGRCRRCRCRYLVYAQLRRCRCQHLAAVIIGVSGLVAFVGFGLWRFERQDAGAVQTADQVPLYVGGGVALVGSRYVWPWCWASNPRRTCSIWSDSCSGRS